MGAFCVCASLFLSERNVRLREVALHGDLIRNVGTAHARNRILDLPEFIAKDSDDILLGKSASLRLR